MEVRMRVVAATLSILVSLAAVAAIADRRIPLTDLGGGTYYGFVGGLYEHGLNIMPPDHFAAGLAAAAAVQPLDIDGQPSPAGRVVMLSIGFLFSSRRRHTRFDCDWSSDVCSSD